MNIPIPSRISPIATTRGINSGFMRLFVPLERFRVNINIHAATAHATADDKKPFVLSVMFLFLHVKEFLSKKGARPAARSLSEIAYSVVPGVILVYKQLEIILHFIDIVQRFLSGLYIGFEKVI